MLKTETAFYLGEEIENHYSGLIGEGNVFLAFEAPSGFPNSEGRAFLSHAKEKLTTTNINNLADLDASVSELIKTKNLPLHVSFAIGFVKENILYLKTAGEGKVIIRRGNRTAVLLAGDNSASGYFQEGDAFMFTTEKFLTAVGEKEALNDLFDGKKPSEIIDDIAPLLKEKGEDKGLVAIFIKFEEEEKIQDETLVIQKTPNIVGKLRDDIRSYYQKFGKRKSLTFITVLLIFVLFLYSVVFGYQRRTEQKQSEDINLVSQSISQKLSQAQEMSYLDMNSALSLINQAKDQLNQLQEKYPKRPEVVKISQEVTQAENKILKKEETGFSEFFDLAVDNADASGYRMDLDGSTLAIIDRTNGTLYSFDLDKKSLAKNQDDSVKKADLIASSNGDQFYYIRGAGVYTFDQTGKAKRVIDNDSGWSDIVDMASYNGNLYLLDAGANQVYKYVPTANGFGSKTSYFGNGNIVDLSGSNSLAIDSSIYISSPDNVLKFTGGAQDGFKLSLPNSNVDIYKIFAKKELTNVYLWDKKNGVVYITDKSGEFVKQVQSSIFSKAQDIAVYQGGIYVLDGSKIYKINGSF